MSRRSTHVDPDLLAPADRQAWQVAEHLAGVMPGTVPVLIGTPHGPLVSIPAGDGVVVLVGTAVVLGRAVHAVLREREVGRLRGEVERLRAEAAAARPPQPRRRSRTAVPAEGGLLDLIA